MVPPRLFPTSFLRGHASSHAPRAVLSEQASTAAPAMRNKTISLARRGSTVLGIEALHQALRQGWRVVSVRSETAPRSAPLDFAVRVTLAMTQPRSLSDSEATPEAAPASS